MGLQTSSLGAALLGRTREAVIGLLYTDPTVGLHVREIARRTGFSAPTVARELRMLESVGVVTSEAIGRQLSYRANPACGIYPELKSIAVKTWGLRGRVATEISGLDGVDVAFIFGSFAAGQAHPTSDVDVIVIGTVDYAVLSEAMSRVSADVGRSVNAKLYRAGEWARKLAENNHFLTAVTSGPKLFLVGNEEALGAIGESRAARGEKAAEPAPAYSARNRKPPVDRARWTNGETMDWPGTSSVYAMRYIPEELSVPISTKTFLNGRSTAVRIPAEFGIKPGEELVVSQDKDGTVRLSRAAPFAGYFAAVERMRAEGADPARDPSFKVPRMGRPRAVDLGQDEAPVAERAPRKRSRSR